MQLTRTFAYAVSEYFV
ncbi:Putative uncharacterized protein [Lactobacillus delbrueckii subsp. lactis]|nr:Putative uncharacterized protein [Lactobacillus delbrueckii subsp. lactis]